MSEPYRISDGRMHGYRIGDLFDSKHDVKDLSSDCERRLLAPIVDHDMALYTVSVLGLQGSGKTEICKYLAYLVQSHYGHDHVNTIVADNPSLAYTELNDRPVQLIVIDDAAQYLSSQSVGKRDAFDKWFMIRHLAEDAANCDTGRVIAVFNWQRYSSVHPNFRNPDLWLFSSIMSDTADIQKVRSRTGNLAYESLSDNWDKIQSGDQNAKSNVMARIPARPLPAGAGWFFTEYMRTYNPEWQGWPEMLRTGVRKTRTREEVLELIREDEQYDLLIKIHDEYQKKKTQTEIATEMGLAQYQISRHLAKLEEIIKEMMENA